MSHFIRYVTILRFCELSGYTEEAVKAKRRDGKWIEGQVWIKAPDGRILIDLEGYEAWAVSGYRSPGFRPMLSRGGSPLPIDRRPLP